MDFLAPYWNGLIIDPITQGIELFARVLHGSALAIIFFTIVVKLALLPLTLKQLKSQKAMQALGPQLAEVKRKYANDRTMQTQETMRIYGENKVNPAAGCLPLFIQMPILIGLYQALYGLSKKGELQASFLWVHTLALPDTWMAKVVDPATQQVLFAHNGLFILPVLAGVGQFIQQRMMMQPTTDPQQKMMNQMMQFMPLMIIYFGFTFPAGLAVYWVTSTLFAIVQQYFITGWGMLLPGTRFSNTPPNGKQGKDNTPGAKIAVSPIPARAVGIAAAGESVSTNGSNQLPAASRPNPKRPSAASRPRATATKAPPPRRQGGKR